MVIKDGVVTNFNGSITTFCTKASKQQNHTFAMVADDPDPRVALRRLHLGGHRGYGFDKLKFDGVVKDGRSAGR